ncbi:MAG: EAL domain-containing protein, partial [Porticoccaceae bacterium]|nr:EAL domain-containing protein [Porticoccaceae bacterium]
VVAEGVETEQQLQFLRQQGCQFAQGYHLGRPMSGEAFGQWLEEYVARESSTAPQHDDAP